MKILQLVDKELHGGGVAVHVSALSAELEKRGHQVIYLRLGSKKSSADIEETHPVLQFPYSYGLIAGHLLRRRFRQAVVEAQPDLVHVHECFTTLSSILLSDLRQYRPAVGTLHDIRPFCYLMTRRFAPTGGLCHRRCGIGCFTSGCIRPTSFLDALRLPRRWMMDRLALLEWQKLEQVIVPSSYMRELALQHGIPEKNLRIIHHGTSVPKNLAWIKDEDVPPLILYLGNLFDYKGVGLLADAFRFLGERPWQAILVGDGPMRATLERDLARHGLNDRVRFYGHVGDRNTINDFLVRARLVVIPSVIPESFSMVGIEALAMGTPVVSFGLGGLTEWLRDGENALVAADSDARDLARQISRLLDRPELAQSLGRSGHELAASCFTTDQAMDQILAVYDEAIKSFH